MYFLQLTINTLTLRSLRLRSCSQRCELKASVTLHRVYDQMKLSSTPAESIPHRNQQYLNRKGSSAESKEAEPDQDVLHRNNAVVVEVAAWTVVTAKQIQER